MALVYWSMFSHVRAYLYRKKRVIVDICEKFILEFVCVSSLSQGSTKEVKNELLFHAFNITYKHLPKMFRKGSIVYRDKVI